MNRRVATVVVRPGSQRAEWCDLIARTRILAKGCASGSFADGLSAVEVIAIFQRKRRDVTPDGLPVEFGLSAKLVGTAFLTLADAFAVVAVVAEDRRGRFAKPLEACAELLDELFADLRTAEARRSWQGDRD